MPTYVALAHWTEQGIRGAKETVNRSRTARELAEAAGVNVVNVYWTLGQYDLVIIFEAPDEETATQFALAAGMQGNIRTTTMRAFTEQEMEGLLERLP